MIPRLCCSLLMLGALGCKKAPPQAPASPPEAAAAVQQPERPGAPPSDWQAPLGQDHPWVGRIWSAGAGDWVGPEALVRRLQEAEVTLLGELHDHPDHHRLQAWVLDRIATPDYAVVFEQLNTDQRIDAQTTAELAHVSGWETTGWPAFALYAPVFDAVYRRGAAVIAGHPTREQVRAAMSEGLDALPEAVTADLPLRPLPAHLRADLAEQIVQSHCGLIDAEGAGPMVAAQTFKDAHMARAILQAGPPAILVAGNGHVRVDRGVPFYLDLDTAAVVMREVGAPPEADEVPDVEGEADFVWFTPRRHDDDPCERFRSGGE